MVACFQRLTAIFSVVAAISHVVALPTATPRRSDSNVVKRSTIPDAPRFVIYGDEWITGQTGPPNVDDIKGYNVFTLSFWLTTGAADQAVAWEGLSDAERKKYKQEYSDAGISLIVSAFGDTQIPTTSGADPVKTAHKLADWVKKYDLDGVDVDYEDFAAMDARDGKAEKWLITFTTELRKKLPKGEYILTHAPVAPWFSPSYTTGAYLKVDQTVGSMIDWYNIQFYNQGTSEYTTCNNLLNASSNQYPKSALFQISDSGVDLNKLVIGKPATARAANNGYMAPSTLAKCVQSATKKQWNAGVMVWEFPQAGAPWIETVRSLAFPE